MSLLANQNILNVAFIHEFEQSSSDKREDYLKWIGEELERPNVSLTKYHYGIVRSGQHIDFAGSVVVIGDINPGGVITAGGNVIVMGTLMGKSMQDLMRNLKPLLYWLTICIPCRLVFEM